MNSIARKYRIASDGFVNCTIDDWNSVLTCIDGYVNELDDKDAQIKKLTEVLDLCESSMTIAMIDTGFDFERELNRISELLAEIKG